jgi:hypothetical protein
MPRKNADTATNAGSTAPGSQMDSHSVRASAFDRAAIAPVTSKLARPRPERRCTATVASAWTKRAATA